MAVDPIGSKPKKPSGASDRARGGYKPKAPSKPKAPPKAPPKAGLKGGRSPKPVGQPVAEGPKSPPSGPQPPRGDDHKDKDKNKDRRRGGMYEYLSEQADRQRQADVEKNIASNERARDLMSRYARKDEPSVGVDRAVAGGGGPPAAPIYGPQMTPRPMTEAPARGDWLIERDRAEQQRILDEAVGGPINIDKPPVTPGGRPHPMARPGYEGPYEPYGPGLGGAAPLPRLENLPSRTPESIGAETARLQGLAEGIEAGTVPWTGETVFGGPRAKANNVPWSALGFDNHSQGNQWANDFKKTNGYWPWQGASEDENENLAQNLANYYGGQEEEAYYDPVEQYIPPTVPEEEYYEDWGGGGWGGGYGGWGGYGGGGGYEAPLPPWFYATQGYGV